MTTTVTATEPQAPSAYQYSIAEPVVHNDKLHVVSKVRGQRVETCNGELLLNRPHTPDLDQLAKLEWCLECQPKVEPAQEGQAPTPEQPLDYGMPAMASAHLRAQAYREAQQQETPAERASTRKARVKANRAIAEAAAPEPKPNPAVEAMLEQPATTARIANQPTLAAIASGKVGNYELMEAPKGVYALRGPDGKLLADNGKKAYRFESKGDAAWYAQRRTRLAQYQGFGGTARLFMPKVGRTGTWPDGRTWSITGELGRDVQANVNGKPVGPVWTHPTNGLVDAMRWLERVERKTNVA